MGYGAIRVSESVKDDLDAEKGEDESRDEQMARLLDDNETPPHPESIERRLAAIESELKDMDQQDGESFTKRVKTLEGKLNDVLNELDDIREAMEAQR